MNNHYNCIYMYTNNINNKRYIGQAVDFNRRHADHKKPSSNKFPIDKAIKKYGIENFSITILIENLKTQEELNYYESLFIKEYNTLIANNEGYNIAEGGHNGNPLQGKTEEEINEIRKKQSESLKGKQSGMYGKHHTESTKKKISDATKGENNPFYGRKHSDETKNKISNSRKKRNVNQYNLDNELIQTWDCVQDACKHFGFDHGNVSKCCKYYENPDLFMTKYKYPCKQAYEYIWRYID